MKKMKMDDFASKICAAVEGKLGGGHKVEVKEVRKNNGVVLHGLLISSKGQSVVPTIYLERFLEAHESGMPFEEVVSKVLSVHEESSLKGYIDIDFFRSFESVRDRICYRLIGRKGNEGLLDEMPYIEFLDLAICFYYSYQGGTLGDGTIQIHNSHMEMWETCTAELFGLAKRNTRRLFPWVCQSMAEVLDEMAGQDGSLEDMAGQDGLLEEMPMRVLSNEQKVHGAACILYPGVLKELAQKEGHDLYIIPSSIHEVILLPVMGRESPEDLKEMIREVNSTQVSPDEVLSYSLYRYCKDEDRVGIV